MAGVETARAVPMANIHTNLLRHWNAATVEARAAGLTWYSEARQTVCRIARQHDTTPAVVAGVIAATSPRIHWCRNVRIAEDLLTGRPVTGVLRASLNKARRIIAGARPLLVLGGNKVRAFYRALLGDTRAAVVDVWMLRASGVTTDKPSNALYRRISEALEALAERLRISVVDLQATIWVVARGRAS